ncbi:ETX/MTX2 family pore-forming toxin [Chryseobacterium arthrosphaerae]|uniref:ETX/MTX2 family pore-forming toxin n=1 Tax=Chryseobacterium arthrosphaerae TaxID=651561 RepID=UPI001BAE7153|nr:ETX/MTX2 family pore-forming toxin [Chryseobacterium arthrosphaerae]QUY57278.1 ETX/MTX2 family pore-forming toxin [Chryseobacterium arthrosphaerae]
MNSLQQITDAWGKWYSQQHGTTCRFTASTDYSSQSFLDDYHQYQVSTTAQNIVYDDNSLPTNGSEIAFKTIYNNNTQAANQQSLIETATSTQAFEWSITEAVSIGVEISATEGVPAVASSTQKVTVNLSLSSTQKSTVTNSQSWSVNTILTIPPQSTIKADIVIGTQSYNINFTLSVMLNGYVAIWNNDKVNGHWLWFIPITQVFSDCIANNIIDTSGYDFVGGGISTTASGVFTGSQGISVGVNTTQYPLNSNTDAAKEPGFIDTPAVSKIVAMAGKE